MTPVRFSTWCGRDTVSICTDAVEVCFVPWRAFFRKVVLVAS